MAPELGPDNAKFVIVRPVFANTRNYLKMKLLPSEYNNITIENFCKMALARILARVSVSIKAFAASWKEKGWFKEENEVGVIASKVDAVEDMAGWPAANTRSTTAGWTKAAFRLARYKRL